MKLRAIAIIAALAVPLAPAGAEDNQFQPKGPPKTMGDEGVLPSTGKVGEHVPTMGTAGPAPDMSGPSTPKGPTKRMGTEGQLPATGTMGGAVPPMTKQSQ